MKLIVPLLSLALLAACAEANMPQSPIEVANALPQNDTCNAAKYKNLIGQNSSALEKTLIIGPVRVLRPGGAMTMDLRPNRINFHFNEMDRITRISCN